MNNVGDFNYEEIREQLLNTALERRRLDRQIKAESAALPTPVLIYSKLNHTALPRKKEETAKPIKSSAKFGSAESSQITQRKQTALKESTKIKKASLSKCITQSKYLDKTSKNLIMKPSSREIFVYSVKILP